MKSPSAPRAASQDAGFGVPDGCLALPLLKANRVGFSEAYAAFPTRALVPFPSGAISQIMEVNLQRSKSRPKWLRENQMSVRVRTKAARKLVEALPKMLALNGEVRQHPTNFRILARTQLAGGATD
jgi:hypothetical protein